MHNKPLEGIRIVEFSTMVTAAMATMMLSEQGASTVKIEPPGTGDTMRHLGSAVAGVSGLWVNCNRGKQLLALDLKHPEGPPIARELCRRADVVISNYRPGVLERLGLGSERLRAENPRLVYVAISGYGSEGPLAAAPAYDHVIQALSGFTAVQGANGGREFVRTLVCDEVTAYTACQAVTAALFQRERSGHGQHVDISMLESALYFLWPAGMMDHTLESDEVARRTPLKELYRSYRTRDGVISIAAITAAHWRGLQAALGIEVAETTGPVTVHTAESAAEVEARLEELPTATALERLHRHDVPSAECLDLEQVLQHPQVAALGAVQRLEHPLLGWLRAPAHPSRFAARQFAPAPACGPLGEHTRVVLGDIGYGAAAIETLLATGVVAEPRA
jgi:crotonobetainyl-CoA:carnitine CoA-transferase CaiB-like acyl-CoA transferase